jgi:virginiamycin B lyase
MTRILPVLVAALLSLPVGASASVAIQAYTLPAPGGYAHDVAVASSGIIWYTAQSTGYLGRFDVANAAVDLVPLVAGAAPRAVVIGPDGAPWITDGGTNAILRVDPRSWEVTRWPLPPTSGNANLNSLTFDTRGRVWFTGQNGIYGRLDPKTGLVAVWDAPRGVGPFGITTTTDGQVYYASLAGNYIAHIDTETGVATVFEPPTPGQGACGVWSDSRNRIWVSEFNGGNVSRYDPVTGEWKTWRLPGEHPRVYAVYVDDLDMVWLSDWGANAMVRFDPRTETFEVFPSDKSGANVRQIVGVSGDVWAPESGTTRLLRYRTR